ncbi:hypothetical protein [Longispora albida]|uniref:hypothetical protein n=1 Tax=Longispora albida TaxID=203523 RepID=UPI00036492BD|nr:hypothetical protein [Longispora albida]
MRAGRSTAGVLDSSLPESVRWGVWITGALGMLLLYAYAGRTMYDNLTAGVTPPATSAVSVRKAGEGTTVLVVEPQSRGRSAIM